jgi:LTXXQ motif family protein
MRQGLRSVPVHARGPANPFAARAFSGRNAQALAARAFDPASAGRRFDPRFFQRAHFAGAFWPGPYFWPYAYYDETFWLWPSAYDAVFWNYGYDDLLYGIYRPYDYDFGGAFGQPRRARDAQPASANFAEWCGSTAPGLTDWPVDNIVATIEPTPEQRALLEELVRVSDNAAQELRVACPRTVPVTPIGRLETLEQQLAALRSAVRTVRPTLEKFYASLSDEQKERFNELGPKAAKARRSARAEAQSDQLARACNAGGDPSRWPTARIEEVVQPTDAQRAMLNELRAATEKAAEIVRSACPTGSALTPTGRLAAMERRIAALRDALETLRPALTKFYASLTDEQKSRFNRTLLSANRAG